MELDKRKKEPNLKVMNELRIFSTEPPPAGFILALQSMGFDPQSSGLEEADALFHRVEPGALEDLRAFLDVVGDRRPGAFFLELARGDLPFAIKQTLEMGFRMVWVHLSGDRYGASGWVAD